MLRAITIAGIMLLSTAVHAEDRLPEHWLGKWCADNKATTEAQEALYRTNACSPDLEDTLEYDGWGGCVFQRIEQVDKETYLIHVRCELQSDFGVGLGKFNEENQIYQLVNGLLFIKRMPEG